MSLEDLIRQNVQFEGSNRHWNHCKCKVCGDYKIRASFAFEADKIGFNCFNCSTTASYKVGSRKVFDEFRNVLNSFGISNGEIDLELGQLFFSKEAVQAAKEKKKLEILAIELPKGSYKLEKNEEDIWTLVAEEYLKSRGFSLDSYDWYLSNDKQFRDRLIIPYFKDSKIIYWDARSFDDKASKRYISAPVQKDGILFNYDELNKNLDKPLFVTEGAFDALSINGVGLGGSKLYKQKADALQKSRRRKIVVIDKKDKQNNGYKLGIDVLALGWDITFTSSDDLDVNGSLKKYGKLWTLKDLLNNTVSGLSAKLALDLKCKNNNKK